MSEIGRARALAAVAALNGTFEVQPTGWLDGAPMDPTAEPPEPQSPVPGYPFSHPGAAAVIVGPTGAGRSSLMQACAYDGAREGVRTAYLSGEVTAPEFHARAAELARRRDDPIDDELREQLTRVRFLDLMGTITRAWRYPETWAQDVDERFDVVVIDPLSTVASAIDLDFDKSNADFVRFYDALVQPLVSRGVFVVMLENVGHAIEARSRAKGASAKQDRPDLTFSCKVNAQPAGLTIVARKIRSVRAPFARGDSWLFDRDGQRIRRDGDTTTPAFRPTVLMERVSRALEAEPGLTRRGVRGATKGKNDAKALALDLLVKEGYVEARTDGGHVEHYSLRPYREADDTGPRPNPHGPVAPEWPPSGPQGPSALSGPPAPTHKAGGQGPLAESDDDLEAEIDRLHVKHADLATPTTEAA